MAHQKSLSCLDINFLHSCEKTFMKSLVVGYARYKRLKFVVSLQYNVE